MTLSRRTVLQLLCAAGVVPGWLGRGARAQTSGAKPFFLVFDDLRPDLSPGAVAAVLSPFAEAGVPVGFVLRTDEEAPADRWTPIVSTLGRFLAASPYLGEIIGWAPGVAQDQPYFQIRAATTARKGLEAALGTVGAGLPAFVSLAGWDIPGAPSPTAVRAAGYRNLILLPPSAGASASRRSFDRLAFLRGGLRHEVMDPVAMIKAGIDRVLPKADAVVLSLSLAGTASTGDDALYAQAEALAGVILDAIRADRVFAALPREHALWFEQGAERLVGLRVVQPAADDAAGRQALDAFAQALREAGPGFSLSPAVGTGPEGGFVPCDAAQAGDPPACIAATALPPDTLTHLADRGVAIIVHTANGGHGGVLDADGLLHLDQSLSLTSAASAGRDLSAQDPLADIVLAIEPSAYATPPEREALLAALTAAGATTRSVFLSLPDYAERLLPEDPVYRVMLDTRRDTATEPPAPGDLSDAERRLFLEDARIAWSYVERLTEPATGLCPSTASFDGEWSSYYRFLTMWDLASLIQATLSAHELGLVDDAAFLARLGPILESVPAERIGGLVLPSEEIRTDRRQVSRPGFNACDTGRLLGALREVDLYPLSRGMGAAVVAKWTIAAALRDGQLQTYTPYGFRPPVLSHCAQYTARALGAWGHAATSPYDVMQGDSPTDARMRLLYQVARIGAIGTEPMLLEAVELGFSAATAYLADVLFTAQARSFAADGRLVCVSETPMDRAPWFSTQGFALSEGRAGAWDIRSADPAPEYATTAFEIGHQVISSKAAFLWAAARPGPYSTRLLDHVRSRARGSEAGYAAGIYAATDVPMTNYTDINTNGIILEAIAYALRGRRPRHAV